MIVVIMGVTGAGKTTVGRLLAARLGASFVDGDDFHSPANIAKMRRGVPLTGADRLPWLAALNDTLRAHELHGARCVLACSALKSNYREVLLRDLPDAQLVYLRGSPRLIAARLEDRRGHYMNPALLASQFNTLEEPWDAIVADIDDEPDAIAADVAGRLRAAAPPPR